MKTNTKRLRRIACHQILLPDGTQQTLSVLEIQDSEVVRCYPLTQELPFTEWLTGHVQLGSDEQGKLRAYYQGKMLE